MYEIGNSALLLSESLVTTLILTHASMIRHTAEKAPKPEYRHLPAKD